MNKSNESEKDFEKLEKLVSEIKVTDERATSGVTDKDIEIKTIKASERTRSHLNSPGAVNRTFSSPEEMVKAANETFKNNYAEELEQDKANGFDINDIESIKKFEIEYCPLQYSVLVKLLNQEEKTAGGIIIPDRTTMGIKAVVIETGLMVSNLEKGDVVLFKPIKDKNRIITDMSIFIDMTFKGVKFKEVPFDALAGVYKKKSVILDRLKEANKMLEGGN